jgi:twitching motility protein PilU
MNVKPLFKLMVEKKASDLFFAPYAPAKIKIEGKIIPVNKLEMTPKMVKQAAFELMDENLLETFARDLEVDFAISESGLGRFRVNVFHQRGNVAMVLRYITSEMPRLDDLDMPEQLKELVMLRRGLVLMVGASGNGKSTTLAAMINHRNEKTSSHIITIEDPIEFLHPNKQSIVNQREVGLDTKSYATALKSAMRSAPDVIQIGEIRDRESMQSAIDMAGTGHLVLATLHSNNAPETLDRIINMFPQAQHAQVFMDLAHYLRGVISQRLVRSRDGKRVAAVELMINTPHIKDLILKGDISEVKEALRNSGERGVQNFDDALLQLYKAGTITLEEAMSHADSRSDLEAKVNFGGSAAGLLNSKHGPGIENGTIDAYSFHGRSVFVPIRHGATGATANAAGHEFLQRYLAGELKLARQRRHGCQHRRRAAGIQRGLFEL